MAAAPRQHLSTLFLSPPPLAGPGSAGGGWEDAGPTVTSPSAVRRAAKRPEGGERHTKNAVSGGGERGRQIRDGNSRPRPLVPPPPELGLRPRRQCGRASAPRASECGRLRSPGPYLTVPRLAQPPPGWLGPRPGKGRPLAPAAGKEVLPRPPSPATCERGKVCGASAGRRGAARPWRSRSQPVTFWTSRQSGPRRARRPLRGGPESVRGRPRARGCG